MYGLALFFKLRPNTSCDLYTVAAWRLDNFYVWLSNTQPTVGQPLNTATCTLCLQFQGRVYANIPVFMPCPAVLPSFRYVIIQSSITLYSICLFEIQVFTSKLSEWLSDSTFYQFYSAAWFISRNRQVVRITICLKSPI